MISSYVWIANCDNIDFSSKGGVVVIFEKDSRTINEKAENSEFWALVLYFLLADINIKADKEWDEFEHELIYKNRFSSDHNIIKAVHDKREAATSTLPRGTVLYRARAYHKNQYYDLLSMCLKEDGASKDAWQSQMNSISEWGNAIVPLIPALLSGEVEENTTPSPRTYRKWKKKFFKGYSAKDSGAPPEDLVPAGRANPDHIRYLYLAEDENTAVYEIRPIINELVSVARFKTTQPLKLYDLTLSFPEKHENPNYEFPSLFDSIGKRFSIPNKNDVTKYIATQYIAEEIKHLGFDGIRFNSSLNLRGKNIVLFEDKYCKAIGSEIRKIGGIQIDVQEADIYKLDKGYIDIKERS